MMRIACGVEYDGSAYHGWQRQLNARSVQAEVERAASFVANHPVETFCAGRTDAGVHATAQVIHFDAQVEREDHQWLRGCNANLPGDIAITWVKQVPESFHARFKATERAYRYIVHSRNSRSALTHRYVSWWTKSLQLEPMRLAAQYLVGQHDFSSFRASECQAKTPVREIRQLELFQQRGLIYIDVCADGFLHHMVRNIAGVLLTIGSGEQPVDWAQQVLQAKDRTQAAITAPPNGLYLTNVKYPTEYQLPSSGYQPVYGGIC